MGALKRKLTYKGTVMEEMVSKNKVQTYFNYFKTFNPLFVDESLDMQRIDDWIEELKSTEVNEKDKEMRMGKQKEYENEKRSAESQEDKEKRLNKQKEYKKEKCSGESELERKRRLNNKKNIYRQPTKDWQQELIDKASLTHICTSECRYRPKASMVVVRENMFTSKQMELLKINNETLSIDGKYYVCKYCKKFIKKKKTPPVKKKKKKKKK